MASNKNKQKKKTSQSKGGETKQVEDSEDDGRFPIENADQQR